MGKYATRKTLKEYCAQAGVTLYKHQPDGASYQYCAGGYIVNGYLGRSMLLSRLQYNMQQTLIFLLKYGSTDFTVYNDGTSIGGTKIRTPFLHWQSLYVTNMA